jgi:hypothetical protein
MEQRDIVNAKIELLRVMLDSHINDDTETRGMARELYNNLTGPSTGDTK